MLAQMAPARSYMDGAWVLAPGQGTTTVCNPAHTTEVVGHNLHEDMIFTCFVRRRT